MLAAVIFLLLASPFMVGAAVARWRPANRFVARHYWSVLVVGWLGVGLLLSRLFVLDGVQGDLATVVGAPLAGLSVWSRRGGGDDGDDEPEDDPPLDLGIDWDQFVEDFMRTPRRASACRLRSEAGVTRPSRDASPTSGDCRARAPGPKA